MLNMDLADFGEPAKPSVKKDRDSGLWVAEVHRVRLTSKISYNKWRDAIDWVLGTLEGRAI